MKREGAGEAACPKPQPHFAHAFFFPLPKTATVSNTKYIDDEYSPSIFRRTAILFKGKGDAPKSAYVAYKPVVFGSTGRWVVQHARAAHYAPAA